MSSFSESITLADLETDPYRVFAQLRIDEPVAFVPAVDGWLVTRWDDVLTVANSPEVFSAEDLTGPVAVHFGSPTIITCDGAAHKSLRDGIAPHYLPSKVKTYVDDLVRPLARQCLETFRQRGSAELLSEYFEPVSAISLARTFGLDHTDGPTLQRWFHGLSLGAINFGHDPQRARICCETIEEMDAALDPVLTRVERKPDTSPLSMMLHHGMPDGKVRSRDFIMPSVRVALLGGMQEPGHGAATTLVGLIDNPDQMQCVLDDLDGKLAAAVNEGVRWISPIGTQQRTPIDDTQLAGVTLPAGASVMALVSSANRDTSKFANPERFDINRTEHRHAAFGFGGHLCAGKHFALPQMALMLRVLFEELDNIRFAEGTIPAFFGWDFRAPKALNVTFDIRH